MRQHLRRAEQELRALDMLIDGRNARNGYCTWPMVRDGVCSALAHVRAAEGLGYVEPPSQQLAGERMLLAQVEEMADDLARRIRAVRTEAYVCEPPMHDNVWIVKLGNGRAAG